MKVIENILDNGDSTIRTEWQGMWAATLWLVPNTTQTALLLEEAGVQPHRLKTPLVSFWRHHHLGDETERKQAFNFAGDRYSPEPGRDSGADWYEPMLAAITPEEVLLRSSGRILEEPSPILVNVGAHMVNYELGKALTPGDHLEALDNMVSIRSLSIMASWDGMRDCRWWAAMCSPIFFTVTLRPRVDLHTCLSR